MTDTTNPSSTPSAAQVTLILTAIERGEKANSEELLPLVYEELRRLARSRLARQPPGQTLQATALVHEAYVRLAKSDSEGWESKAHFFAAAAESMRRIVIDNIRRKSCKKHGGENERVDVEVFEIAGEMDDDQLLAVNEALDLLEESNQEAAQLVKLRFFAGLTLSETAMAMGLAERTAKRRWSFARAWLYREIKRDQE